METILCSRILKPFSIKYLIYTRQCLKLIDEVIKIINWNFHAIRYLYYGTVWSHLKRCNIVLRWPDKGAVLPRSKEFWFATALHHACAERYPTEERKIRQEAHWKNCIQHDRSVILCEQGCVARCAVDVLGNVVQ
jgi:hypothetical protein